MNSKGIINIERQIRRIHPYLPSKFSVPWGTASTYNASTVGHSLKLIIGALWQGENSVAEKKDVS